MEHPSTAGDLNGHHVGLRLILANDKGDQRGLAIQSILHDANHVTRIFWVHDNGMTASGAKVSGDTPIVWLDEEKPTDAFLLTYAGRSVIEAFEAL